jgi:hypothetical protein
LYSSILMSVTNNNNDCIINNYYTESKTDDDNIESFRILSDYPDYMVSNFGRVISRKCKKEKFMKQTLKKGGHLSLTLYKNKKSKTFGIHHLIGLAFISNPENKPIVDHIDRNKLNNNIINLRWVTYSENRQNVGISKRNTSTYKGVSFNKVSNKYKAQIGINGKSKHLGYYITAEEASEAYETQAKIIHGEFYYKYKKDLK